MGPTLLISTIVFVLIIVILLLLLFCSKRPNVTIQRRVCIEKLDKKIFFNPFIRYSLVNALKLNLNAFIALKAYASKDTGERVTAILMLTIINIVPIVLARLLCKRKH